MFRHKRHRRRNRYKRNTKIIVASFSLLVLFISVGYAAFSTNIDLHIKGNVKPSLTPEELKTLTVSSGDGLYDNGDNTYTYKGADPHNYITLGSDTYRIMGIDENNNLKVIKDESIGNIIWDPGYATSISGVTEANSVSGTRYSNNQNDYCYVSSESEYNGCNSWGSASTTYTSDGVTLASNMPRIAGNSTKYDLPADEAYINTYLNNTFYNSLAENIKTKINIHIFNVGPVSYGASHTLATEKQQAAAYTWKGKIGLMTITDYVEANTNSALCGNIYLNMDPAGNYETCKTTNWLYKNTYEWTISPHSHTNSRYVLSGATNNAGLGAGSVNVTRIVRPVFYLSSNIRLIGTGTSDNSYEIKS